MTTWVLVPGTPILLPGVAGASDPAADLRAACVAEIEAALVGFGGESVTVLAAGSSARRWPDEAYELARLVAGPSTGSGSREPGSGNREPGSGNREPGSGNREPGSRSRRLPLALAVGRHLVRAAGWDGEVALQTLAEPLDVDAGLVVAVGDGSLLRHEKGGPGPQHPRAREFDEALRSAVQAGDVTAIAALDSGLADELGVTGTVPWLALAATAASADVAASVRLADDPFGPYALVATWRWT